MTETAYADLSQNKLVLDRQMNNFEVHLEDYYSNFSNTNGDKLIGWDKNPDGNYIPDYYPDAVIGVDKENPVPNNLYAVWEPMVYLTLQNSTQNPVTFDLRFEKNSAVYTGQTNIIEDYLRYAFTQGNSDVTVTTKPDGTFTVTLNAQKEVKLAVPEGLGYTYTISGTYQTPSSGSGSNLMIYNSGDPDSVSIEYNSATRQWDKHYGAAQTQHSIGSGIPYTTAGELIKGTQGQFIMFSESDPTTTLNVKTGYYETATEQWVETVPQATPAFVLDEGTGTATGDGTSVKLINNNQSVKFGLKVTDTGTDYKFIGWYTSLGAKPNEPTLDGDVSGFGQKNITGLSVPLTQTTYYALYVPYASGDLKVTHSQKRDSAGKCDDTNGLTLSVTYGGATVTSYGNADTPALYTVNVNEKTLTDSDQISIKVGAKAKAPGYYDATYRGDTKVTGTEDPQTGYYEYTETFIVTKLLIGSDAVKGLLILNDVAFTSEFSIGYKITYTYTARDGRLTNYNIEGRLSSYDEEDFKEFVIERTPYTRTLTGDTIWDTDHMTVLKEDSGVTAALAETPNVRGVCKVTINMPDGVRYETVPYGQTFTQAQAEKRIAPETKDGLLFDHWSIINTKTGGRISECYDREFHFAVWNDYTIEPVYSENPTGDPTPAWQFVTIDYIDTSRNQWGLENITNDVSDRQGVTDKVVADLDISFNDGTNLILETLDENENYAYQLGVIFEQVGTTDANGQFNKNDFAATESPANVKNRVKDVLEKPKSSGTATDAYYNSTTGYYYTRIDINEDTVSDFNRSEFARSFTTANVKDKVFRVYAYMILPGDDDTVDDSEIVISAPYYMTMFDYANTNLVIERE